MMMEIYFDEEKCKEHNYDINERYQIIDKFFEDNHVKKQIKEYIQVLKMILQFLIKLILVYQELNGLER